jgi:hypothetical protein
MPAPRRHQVCILTGDKKANSLYPQTKIARETNLKTRETIASAITARLLICISASAYKFSTKNTSTGARAHALFDADAARSYPAFSLKGLCASRSCGKCGESER